MRKATLAWRDIAAAADIIRAGGLVAIPTETVYGLAADATNDSAVARIFEAKGRPSFNPLIIHVTGSDDAFRHVAAPALAEKLAAAFWPGPLTLVLKRRADSKISLLASAGLDTIALRAPDHAVAQAVLKAAGTPLAAPSANRSGSLSPTTADHVRAGLGDRVDMILDGGSCAVGVESTIVKIDGARAVLLRTGGLARETIEEAIGASLERPSSSAVEAPGMMASHYAPRAPLRMDVVRPREDEAFLAFGGAGDHPHALDLSPSKNIREAAANLFAHLHALDAMVLRSRLSGIAAAPVPTGGLGEAINDRLRRAEAR